MDKNVIRYTLENGEEISIMGIVGKESAPVDDGFGLVGAEEKILQAATTTIDKSLAKINTFSKQIFNSLKAIEPDELKVEFGATFTAEAGVIISFGTEFNVKVELTWRKECAKS